MTIKEFNKKWGYSFFCLAAFLISVNLMAALCYSAHYFDSLSIALGAFLYSLAWFLFWVGMPFSEPPCIEFLRDIYSLINRGGSK